MQETTTLTTPKPSLIKEVLRLGKLRLSTSVVFSSVAGYFLGMEVFSWTQLALLIFGGITVVAASNAYNQIYEKDRDALMNRTKGRPLPLGTLTLREAWFIATFLLVVGLWALYEINPMTAYFGALSVVLYTLVYTPLKAITPLAVFVGAIPGAIPYMLGWVAARNDFDIETGTLFAQQFFWQFPHFWAIAWFSYHDYEKAGYFLLPSKAKDRSSQLYIIIYTVWMIMVGILPVFGITGELQLSWVGAIAVGALGYWVLNNAILLLKDADDKRARKLMLSSIAYLTGMQIIYIIDRFI
ncbi:MAG: protoheme IX farnesyltransferase [Cryomorphaceae bacterium]|nr:protoheme IX farnesyltransferase [Cryomorphaceae bacterium]MBL6682186.1 protoheme IX farnesyltransferase [Cryomorphaceae bacterium]MBL6867521.1 protoheme IX farnesyltransferase [Cryomorphaceae bacterium]